LPLCLPQVAGAKAWLKASGSQGRTVVAVTSGANINFERLRLVAELADLGSSTEVGSGKRGEDYVMF
jgi:threonine dehydratase